jgi:hypothetical protein
MGKERAPGEEPIPPDLAGRQSARLAGRMAARGALHGFLAAAQQLRYLRHA